MVLKSLNLARQSLAKTFTHGYAQSLVAATQSSYASQNQPFGTLHSQFALRFGGKAASQQHHSAFPSSKHGQPDQTDSGLAAYYAAWQKRQTLGEWQQYQFAKRIEWAAPAAVVDGKKASAEEHTPENVAEQTTSAPALVAREYSSNAVDDFENANGSHDAEAVAVAEIDESLAEDADEVAHVKDSTLSVSDAQTISTSRASRADPAPAPDSLQMVASPASVDSATLSQITKATTVSVPDTYAEQLNRLAEQRQYNDIPALFEYMLMQGVKPTASAYNALLVSALHLTHGRHHVVPKALDIYANMLRRRVSPDSTTYTTLIELLSTRAIDVLASKSALEEKRVRYGGMEEGGKFMFGSNSAEYDMLAEDDSLALAVKAFRAAVSSIPAGAPLAESAYRSLIIACAQAGKVDDMVSVYSHMKNPAIVPRAHMFVVMIEAFGKSGDLRSAVECYDEYKALAYSSDRGEIDFARMDDHVSAALIKAYEICYRSEGALKFMDKAVATYPNTSSREQFKDTVALQAIVPLMVQRGQLEEALSYALDKVSPTARDQALAVVCPSAADSNQVDLASRVYSMFSDIADLAGPALAMSAMHIRAGNVAAADEFWRVVEGSTIRPECLEAATMHTIAMVGSNTGSADVGLRQCRVMFSRLRDANSTSSQARSEVVDQIDEAIELIGQFVSERGIALSANSSMELMWAMIDNGGPVASVACHLLAGLGPGEIAELSWEDVNLLIQVQTGMIINGSRVDVGHEARFAHLFDVVLASGMPLNNDTVGLMEQVLPKIGRTDLSQRWLQFRYPVAPPVYWPAGYIDLRPTLPATTNFEDTFDPYGGTTDNKGSVAITDLLDKAHGRSASHLDEALTRFKNIRRAGRHPRFFTYAKLISAAAREDRMALAHEILALAKQDVPFIPQYRIVRFGWASILDAMLAACLTTGNRQLAAQFHQDLLNMGAAPSANTFGLYITTLKESTRTFDEASEAVKIFTRARAEGVEPSSFLYNALIGKLGKARRIDDCLSYFTEMRNLGIRPTSVTYGTIVNALCRVSDEKYAEELFEEMENMANYKPRPAPYHSMMQFFLSTKRDRSKVLAYYDRMRSRKIQATAHTYKLLIDTHATLEPIDMTAAEAVLETMRKRGEMPEAVHYASLIHAKGCVLHGADGAKAMFDSVLADARIRPQACLYQALFEGMVANHLIEQTEPIVQSMRARRVDMTPYIANSLIHGWAMRKNIAKAEAVYRAVPEDKREPSTYEAMTRAFMAVEDRAGALGVVSEGLARGYPAAVANKISDLVAGGRAD